jgi:hypothetical protein
VRTLFAAGILGLAFVGSLAFAQERDKGDKAEKMKETPGCELRAGMRKLWEDHITYTRNFIISSVGGLADADEVAKRLLKNQDEIGDAIKPFYGADAGKKLAALLRDHILIAADVVKAAKGGNKDEVDAQQKRWTANSKEIAAFLSGANPNWKKASLEEMLQKHLDLTTQEVVCRLKKDWAGDIKAYDQGHEHMLEFSDMLIEGIVAQQPDKFKGN